MKTALMKAIELILNGSLELNNILSVTARMSLSSSIIARLIGVPIGIWLGSCRFPGRTPLLVSFRTL
ncbi:MAG: tungstate transporter permease, partial [Clostridia bacterium]|nr:tungstate transporter permease [Clostridia bacterium]